MKHIVFFSAPRTRSTVLFEALAPFVEKATGQRRILGHTELFLEVNRNVVFNDLKTGKTHLTEMFPMYAVDGNIEMHYVHPHVLKTTELRNKYKLGLLREQRAHGFEYFVKCTLEVVDSLIEVMEFYQDYQIVITKRKDLVQYCLSNLAARVTGLYHARADNVEIYRDVVHRNPIVVDLEANEKWLDDLLWYTSQLWQVGNHVDATVIWYEDMETDDQIKRAAKLITGHPRAINLTKGNLPIKLTNDYEAIFANYDALLLTIERAIDRKINGF